MDLVPQAWGRWLAFYDEVWEKRDKRMDGWPLMSRYYPPSEPFLSRD
jgi:hypothetical protein